MGCFMGGTASWLPPAFLIWLTTPQFYYILNDQGFWGYIWRNTTDYQQWNVHSTHSTSCVKYDTRFTSRWVGILGIISCHSLPPSPGCGKASRRRISDIDPGVLSAWSHWSLFHVPYFGDCAVTLQSIDLNPVFAGCRFCVRSSSLHPSEVTYQCLEISQASFEGFSCSSCWRMRRSQSSYTRPVRWVDYLVYCPFLMGEKKSDFWLWKPEFCFIWKHN